MRLDNHPLLDALCGEYIAATLRGAARRRFEHFVRTDPRVAQRLRHWESLMTPRYSDAIEVEPPSRVWEQLERELGLASYRTPWYRRLGLWQGWTVAATAALLIAIVIPILRVPEAPPVFPIAQLAGKDDVPQVTAHLSRDRQILVLRAARPVIAGPSQSYELWLIPVEGGNPVSLAVLGDLDAQFAVPTPQVPRLRPGAKLAVSTEPAGGSPTGQPTGPVILAGEIKG